MTLSMVTFKPITAPENAQRFFEILARAGGIYIPERVDGKRYTPGQHEEITRRWARQVGLLLKRRKPFEVNTVLTISLNRLRAPARSSKKLEVRIPSDLFLAVDERYFASPRQLLELVSLGNEMYDFFSPCYGFITLPWMPLLGAATFPWHGLPGWGWATWLGPEYDSIVSLALANGVTLTHLPDGGRLVVLPSPKDPNTPDESCLQAYDHIVRQVDPLVFQPQRERPAAPAKNPTELARQISEIIFKPVVKESVRLPQFRCWDSQSK